MKLRAITFETLISVAVNKFLKESGISDYCWVATLSCMNCDTLSKAYKESDDMIFECPKCNYRWKLALKGLGFKNQFKKTREISS